MPRDDLAVQALPVLEREVLRARDGVETCRLERLAELLGRDAEFLREDVVDLLARLREAGAEQVEERLELVRRQVDGLLRESRDLDDGGLHLRRWPERRRGHVE